MADRAGHLSEEQLACLQDGEGPRADRRHLDTCADCAARLRDLNLATAVYSEYQVHCRPQLPPPPNPWPSLDSLLPRTPHLPQPRKWIRWWPVLASAVFLLAVLLTRKQPDQAAAATDLLTRSSAAEPSAVRTIAIEMDGRTMLRPAVLITRTPPELQRVEALFTAARYDWDAPLSPRRFQQWRSRLAHKRDFVTRVERPGEQPAWRVRTENPDGLLRSASLTLRGPDLEATSGVFEFTGPETVSIGLAEPAAAAPDARASSTPAPAPVETPVGPEDELRVLAALHEIGADVGEPIDIAEDPAHSEVIVRAAGLPEARRREVAAALQPLPRVRLDLQTPAPTAPAAPSAASRNGIPAAMRQRLEEQFGGAVALQEATDRLLEAAASALARAHALQTLDTRFPPPIAQSLSSASRTELAAMRHQHIQELRRLAAQIRSDLQPVLTPNASSPPSAADPVAASRLLDDTLGRLLAGSYSQSEGEAMLRALPSQVDALDRAIPQ